MAVAGAAVSAGGVTNSDGLPTVGGVRPSSEVLQQAAIRSVQPSTQAPVRASVCARKLCASHAAAAMAAAAKLAEENGCCQVGGHFKVLCAAFGPFVCSHLPRGLHAACIICMLYKHL